MQMMTDRTMNAPPPMADQKNQVVSQNFSSPSLGLGVGVVVEEGLVLPAGLEPGDPGELDDGLGDPGDADGGGGPVAVTAAMSHS